jgi:2-dehydro-3-deoxygluconokinase
MNNNRQRIATLGEAMVEFFDTGNNCWRRGFAGDSLNVAWALRALLPDSWSVDYVTRVGRDGVSDDLLEFLSQADLGSAGTGRDPERTLGLYTIKTDAQGERTFDYWRSQSAAKLLADDAESLERALSDMDWVYLSGISAAVIESGGRKNLLSVVESLRARGVKFVYDPNFRPKLWGDLAQMRDFSREIARLSELVMPTFDDEIAAFGDRSPDETADRLLSWGAKQIIVKNGTEPTLSADSQQRASFEVSSPVLPVDTTGAGDSFNGGFLSAYIQGASVEESIRKGQAISARVVQQRGALVPYAELRAI